MSSSAPAEVLTLELCPGQADAAGLTPKRVAEVCGVLEV